jgi:hypothetical protein
MGAGLRWPMFLHERELHPRSQLCSTRQSCNQCCFLAVKHGWELEQSWDRSLVFTTISRGNYLDARFTDGNGWILPSGRPCPYGGGYAPHRNIFLSATGIPSDMCQQPTGLQRIQHIERRWRWGIPAKVLVERSEHTYIIPLV